jgi:hypothetical protein
MKIDEISKSVLEKEIIEGKSISSVSKKLGFRGSSKISDMIRAKCEEYDIPYLHLFGEKLRKSRRWFFSLSKEEVEEIIGDCKSFSELYKKTDLRKDIKNEIIDTINKYDIDLSHFINNEKKNLTGQTFGSWVVIEEQETTGHRSWMCKCSCGTIKNVLQTHLIQGKSKSCLQCCSLGNKSACYKGYEGLSGNKYTSIKKGAEKRGYQFEVDIIYLWELYVEQDKKCNLTKMDIEFGKVSNGKGTASLDRINNNEGYVEGNVQWLHKDVNIMKNKFEQEHFIHICERITNNSKK